MNNPEFAVHRLSEEGLARAQKIAEAYDTLLDTLREVIVADGREFNIAKTKLEESCFFAKKALAVRPQMQQGFYDEGG